MIHLQFAIYDREQEKIKKIVESSRFADEKTAQEYINKMDFNALFSSCRLNSFLSRVLVYRNTTTGEKSIESID